MRQDREQNVAAVIYEIAAWLGDAAAIEAGLGATISAAGPPEIDLYRPLPDRDDGAGPRLIAHLGFADEAAARAFLAEPAVDKALRAARERFGLRGELMRVREFPIGARPPAPLSATFSYVVRYELPADDVAHFQDYYMRMHPPILAEFARIRNIFCYVPLDSAAPLPRSGYLIGNEVVFDSVADFDRAMDSPVRAKSRADAETFPPFSGRNPHYPMMRRRVR